MVTPKIIYSSKALARYVETVAQFGGMIETRVGMGTQRHPIFVRMLDKDSIWGSFNGLQTLVPSLLHFGESYGLGSPGGEVTGIMHYTVSLLTTSTPYLV